MTALPEGQTATAAWQPSAYRLPSARGWKLAAWGLLWSLAAFAGAFLVGFFFGVVFTVTGIKTSLSATDLDAFYGLVGVLGSFAVLLWVSFNIGAERGSGEAMASDEAPRRPVRVVLAALILLLYSAFITFSVLSTVPEFLQKTVGASWWVITFGFFITVIGAPIAEEIFYRGWLWDGLRRSWGPLATAAATSVLWLLIHAPDGLARVTILLPGAIVLSYARHRGGSVWAPLIIHAANNAVAAGIAWLALWLGWLAWP